MSSPDFPRDEAEAALAARAELGADLEPAVVDAFVDRIERAVDARIERAVDDRVGARLGRRREAARPVGGGSHLVLGVMSLGLAIPLTAVAGGTAGLLGILLVWIGIVAVNVAHARGGWWR